MKRKLPPVPVHDPAQTLACLVADLEALKNGWIQVANAGTTDALRISRNLALRDCATEIHVLLAKLPKGKP